MKEERQAQLDTNTAIGGFCICLLLAASIGYAGYAVWRDDLLYRLASIMIVCTALVVAGFGLASGWDAVRNMREKHIPTAAQAREHPQG